MSTESRPDQSNREIFLAAWEIAELASAKPPNQHPRGAFVVDDLRVHARSGKDTESVGSGRACQAVSSRDASIAKHLSAAQQYLQSLRKCLLPPPDLSLP